MKKREPLNQPMKKYDMPNHGQIQNPKHKEKIRMTTENPENTTNQRITKDKDGLCPRRQPPINQYYYNITLTEETF